MSLRGTDVAAMMTRVEATLVAAEQSPGGARGVLPVVPEGDAEINVAVLRKSADIRLDFPPGSARPVVGAVVRLGKRTLRRAVRWYVSPMMEQQSRFNHALLDGIERLRVRIDHLPHEAETGVPAPGTLPSFGAGRAVAVGPGGPALAELVSDDTATPPDALPGDPAEQLAALTAASIAVVVGDATGLGPAAAIAFLRAARAALAPGGVIILSAADDADSLRLPALQWALSATGFSGVTTPTMPPVGDATPTMPPVGDATPTIPAAGGPDELPERLAQVDALARAAGVVLVARRDGQPSPVR